MLASHIHVFTRQVINNVVSDGAIPSFTKSTTSSGYTVLYYVYIVTLNTFNATKHYSYSSCKADALLCKCATNSLLIKLLIYLSKLINSHKACHKQVKQQASSLVYVLAFLVIHEQWHKAFLNVLLIIPVTFRCQKPIVTIVTPTKCIVTTIGCSHSPEIRTSVVVLCLLFLLKTSTTACIA